MKFFRTGLSGYLSSGAELGNMTGKAILSLLGTLIEEVGVFALRRYRNFKNRRNGEKSIGGGPVSYTHLTLPTT